MSSYYQDHAIDAGQKSEFYCKFPQRLLNKRHALGQLLLVAESFSHSSIF